jgi:hypothetical protein
LCTPRANGEEQKPDSGTYCTPMPARSARYAGRDPADARRGGCNGPSTCSEAFGRAGRSGARSSLAGLSRAGAWMRAILASQPTLGAQSAAAVRGVTVPWTLAACRVAGRGSCFRGWCWEPGDHCKERSPCRCADHHDRGLRRGRSGAAASVVNLLLGLWLIAAPWLLSGGDASSIWNDVASGIAVVGLSLPPRDEKQRALRGVGPVRGLGRLRRQRIRPMLDDAQITYPPVNTLKPVAQNVWIVDGPAIRFGWHGRSFASRRA